MVKKSLKMTSVRKVFDQQLYDFTVRIFTKYRLMEELKIPIYNTFLNILYEPLVDRKTLYSHLYTEN